MSARPMNRAILLGLMAVSACEAFARQVSTGTAAALHGSSGSPNLNFPVPLRAELKKLEEESRKKDPDERAKKKLTLLEKSLSQFNRLHLTSTVTTHTLPDERLFELTSTKEPAYFKKPFSFHNMVNVSHEQAGHYSYEDDRRQGITDVWVDFANRRLGGGVFGHGFVQEEIMCMEMPEMANAAANHLITRKGGDGILQGSPVPWLFRGARRVMEIQGVYGDDWLHTSLSQIEHDSPLLPRPQQVIVLAIAAPQVTNSTQRASLDTIKDVFNTCYAGFSLTGKHPGAHEPPASPSVRSATPGASGGRVRVNTGPIGAGAFGNDKIVVYVVQRLAAMEANVDLRFWAYNDAEVQIGDSVYFDKILTHYSDSKHKTIEHLLEIVHEHLSKLPRSSAANHHHHQPRPRRSIP
jgi:Poly (ADP-ribose) glycohydrolase (PARG)